MSYAPNEDREHVRKERELAKRLGDDEESEMVRDHVINSLQHLEKIQCEMREFVEGLCEKLDPILRNNMGESVMNRPVDPERSNNNSYVLRRVNDAMEYERVTLELLRETKERIDLP